MERDCLYSNMKYLFLIAWLFFSRQAHNIMTQDKVSQNGAKIEVQYSGEDSFMVDKILLEFDNDERIFSVQYEGNAERIIARFLRQGSLTDTSSQTESWVLEKNDTQSGNVRFKITIDQSVWRFQRIEKEVEVTQIRGIMRKITRDKIIYEYAAPLSHVSKIEIFGNLNAQRHG